VKTARIIAITLDVFGVLNLIPAIALGYYLSVVDPNPPGLHALCGYMAALGAFSLLFSAPVWVAVHDL
jgi:hypothetical protein